MHNYHLSSEERAEQLEALKARFQAHEISANEFRRECYKIGVAALDVDDMINAHSRGRARDDNGGQGRLPFKTGLRSGF